MPYEVIGLLGRGGMAVVELAIDTDGRRLARKRLPLTGPVAEMEVARRRLRREAQVLARLEHPGIVPLLAVEDDGADVILVMPALAASLADRVQTEGTLSSSEVWRMGQVLLDALAWAHRHGVVHRDIKPANVLFDAAGNAALADFGIARASDLTQGLTVAGSLLGTPEFIAPEQARGEPAGPPSDVFSLAATLGYALTGRSPYGGGDPVSQAMRAARGEVRADWEGVPATLTDPLRAMLDPLPERRPSAAALLGGPSGTEPGGYRPSLPARPGSLARSEVTRPGPRAQPRRRPLPPAPIVIPSRIPSQAPGPAAAPRPLPPDVPAPIRQQLSPQRTAVVGAQPAPVGTSPPAPPRWRRWARTTGRLLGGGPARPTRLARRVTAATVAGMVAMAAVWVGLSLGHQSPDAPAASASPRSICAPLPYQPCGQSPAPHTDGLRCLPGWYDVDGSAADGCEATADAVNHQPLVAGKVLSANLVPVGEIDTYPLQVKGGSFFSCGGRLTVTLRAPSGVTDQVQIFGGIKILAAASSTDSQPAAASVSKPSCFGRDSEDLTVAVSGVAGASGADYALTRSSGW